MNQSIWGDRLAFWRGQGSIGGSANDKDSLHLLQTERTTGSLAEGPSLDVRPGMGNFRRYYTRTH